VATNSRAERKRTRKDQTGPREAREEVNEETRSSGAKPLVRQPNRDLARGDRGRTGVHQDVGTSRAPEDEDEPTGEGS
jgi:hypothetical protein